MSFDVFLQTFEPCDEARVQRLRVMLGRLLDDTRTALVTRDGGADVYGADGSGESLLLAHLEGKDIWDVVVDVARTGALAIMPTGESTCVVDSTHLERLPEELRTGAVCVGSGADLLRVVAGH